MKVNSSMECNITTMKAALATPIAPVGLNQRPRFKFKFMLAKRDVEVGGEGVCRTTRRSAGDGDTHKPPLRRKGGITNKTALTGPRYELAVL